MKKTVRDIEIKGKKALVRCDFNVPLDENKNITDNRRIVAALPTIKYLLENECAIILCSHLGRPKGEFKEEFSLKPVAKELSKQLGKEVIMANDVIGEDAMSKAANLKEGEIMLLENVRFHREETDNDPEFAKKLAEKYEKAKDYIIYLHLHNFITDSEEERIFDRMHNRIKRNIKPKED